MTYSEAGQLVWIPYGIMPLIISIAKEAVTNFVWLPLWNAVLFNDLSVQVKGAMKGSIMGHFRSIANPSKSDKVAIQEITSFFG
jgi:hypothetical protein